MGNCPPCSPLDLEHKKSNNKEEKPMSSLKVVTDSKDELDISSYNLPKKNKSFEIAKTLTDETKRAMAWAHFLADIWHRYMNVDHKCEFLADDDNMGDILDDVIIFGGGCRDYIMGKEFDDIDMFLNTRELNKIHLNHLRKYHCKDIMTQSDSVKCCYWKLYARKFKAAQLDYQLNGTYFMHILMHCNELKGKLSVTNYKVGGKYTVYMMKLLDDVYYKGYNLKGQDLDLADSFKLEVHQSVKEITSETLQMDEIKKIGRLYHQKSVQIFKAENKSIIDIDEDSDSDFEPDIKENEESDDKLAKTKKNKLMKSRLIINVSDHNLKENKYGLKEISLPISETKARETFSGNVILSEFYQTDKNLDKYEWNVWGTIDTTYLNDGLKDLQNKVLRTAMKDPLYTIKIQYTPKRGSVHFWRLIKFKARYGNEWSVDTKLKRETLKFNSIWLNEERFTNKEWYQVFVVNMIEKYVKTADDHSKRFEAMKQFEMHQYVVPFFKKFEGFRTCLLDKMNSFSDDHTKAIQTELKKYGYTD